MKKKLLLVRVPEVEFHPSSSDPRVISVAPLSIPLGITSLGACVLEHGAFQVKLLDLYLEDYEASLERKIDYYRLPQKRLMSILEEYHPSIVGFSSLFLFGESCVTHLSRVVKEFDPTITVLQGGAATLIPEVVLSRNYNVDVVFLGESERSLIAYLKAREENTSLESIPGIAYREGEVIRINIQRDLVEDLDTLPFPAYDLLSLDCYFALIGRKEFTVLTSRGCPFRCAFCAGHNYSGRVIRFKNVQKVVSELKELKERYGLDYVNIHDENFTFNLNRAKAFLRLIIDAGLKFKWRGSNGFHVNTTDFEFLELCKRSGCVETTLAIESASPRVLREIMHKDVDLDLALALAEYCHQIDLPVFAFFVIGSPGETKEEILTTIDFATKLQVHGCTFAIATPFPGTEYYDVAKARNYLRCPPGDFHAFKTGEPMMETEDFTAG